MAPVLPSSLSPHVCILPSPDLSELLEASALPPLQHILQSFSPLPQVTTRTTSLISVPHSSFALRFSDLHEVEEACREPEEQRALRSLDWMTSRINKRCEQWVREMEERGERELSRVPHEDRLRTPWWDELRRCAEGDFVPDRVEGWNHPVAVILAVSTTAPNPLQAITALYSRVLQFPPWVDTNVLRYVLIVHPQDSQFSDEEANALFNAVKKQYGLNCYLLSLELPSPPPAPIPVPALLPRLPPPSGLQSPESTRWQPPATPNTPGHHNSAFALNTLRMDEKDIQQTARFTREFLVMSLIPWMEKCVVEWNENYSSTRRLPSRLFSSTRRLFGSPSPSPAPGHSVSSSVSSLPGRSMTTGSMNGGAPTPPSQLRRLAEFATILGDFKLAASVWESLRKESKGGSDMLPLMSAPSPALQLHASNALLSLHPSAVELPPHAQLRALLYAARWEVGIDPRDFVSNALEGERWFVWAAGNAEEAPAALLLAHAALLTSMRKNSYRRAAFWYVTAANRLEKCGIKPLTIYFLRKAHELFQIRPPKELSPSFWDSENKSESKSEEFVDVRSGVEYPLARLLYTSGRVTEAVQMFLEILRGAPYPTLQPPTLTTLLELEDPHGFPSEDKTFLDDFRVAFAHLQSTEPEKIDSLNLTVPFKFCQPKQCKVRYPGGDRVSASPIWESCEEDWNTYQKTSGNKQPLAIDRKVCANELFWVDVTLNNPLTAEVNLGNVTLLVERRGGQEEEETFVDIEVIQEVTLRPRETRTIPISLKCSRPSSIIISAVRFDFLSLLPVTETLASRGRRLHDTQAQRITPTYAPDVLLKVDVASSLNKLTASFVEDGELTLMQGEIRELKLWFLNSGSNPVEEVWVVTGNDQEIWIGTKEEELTTSSRTEIVHSRNSLRPTEPQRIPLAQPLQPNEGVTVPISLHGGRTGTHNLYFFITYRESESAPFHSVRLERSFEVEPLLDVQVSALPSSSSNYSFVVNVETTSLSQSSLLNITQISTISPLWKLAPIANSEANLAPSQSGRFSSAAEQWLDGEGKKESLEFVLKKLDDVLQGNFITLSDPPELDLICSHLFEMPDSQTKSFHSPSLQALLHAGRRKYASEVSSLQHPHIPAQSLPHIFPLYNPASVDVAVFWEIPSQGRQGYTTIYGTRIGAAHAPLNDIIDKSENTKVKRSMYAETQREKLELVEGIRNSEWNAEMDPISVSVEDVSEIDHDFSKGPIHVPLKFMVRNHSPLFDTQVTLRLRSRQGPAVYPQHTPTPFPAPYSGKLTFRTTISASEATVLQARVLISRPGIYHIGGWAVESEVLVEIGEVTAAEGRGETRKRFRYIQEHPPNSEASIIVRGPRRTSS
ncbi:ER-golgi trafficking TRAPP I complex 85 kDa subunit-domain-containing protein [Ephemerocybe angulata]|uniref:ER-golgi trafficking TRAPP I complex 85 kDa subunit-domain-containing protein n=1 Tax=Ephemerocybe angulata TaxID=980116 RepID=A0A8H6IIX5_9AGAR|nr:ER-golgi trafficking TRAPP I complex 85 kDa subunit-domain-containing protein [Tulosesus angulatus]